MPRSWILVAALILTISTLAVSGCTSNSPAVPAQNDTHDSMQEPLPKDKYVAIEELQMINCTLINGTYPFPPHTSVRVPFVYDNSANGSNWAEGSSWMNGDVHYDYLGVNDSFKALLGTSCYREVAPRSSGWDLKISNVYGYPYTGESGFTIRNIDGNGTVHASYNNTSIILKPGEQWASPTSSEIKADNGTGFRDEPYSYTAILNTTWTVSNLGIVDKANLTGKYNPP